MASECADATMRREGWNGDTPAGALFAGEWEVQAAEGRCDAWGSAECRHAWRAFRRNMNRYYGPTFVRRWVEGTPSG